MNNRTRFVHLLSPIIIRGLPVKNRIVSSGHATRLADGHVVAERLLAYHTARAVGGAGLIITEAVMVDENAVVSSTHLVCSNDQIIPSWRRLSDALHQHGCAVFGQVFHLGLEQPSAPDGTRAVAYGPSVSPSERYHTAAREMSKGMIRDIVGKFGDAALRMKQGGLDGVEMAASHGYLLAQFLSPQINRRTDEYGGSFENRLRIVKEIALDIRGKIGDELVVGVRISGDEMTTDGLTSEDAVSVCQALSEAGLVDYFNVTSGSSREIGAATFIVPPMGTDVALTAPFAAAVKAKVKEPVIAVGRINDASAAEQVLAGGQADLCGMTRAMICDPEMPNKISQGRPDDVRLCIACNQACIDRMHRGFGISCIQHPETGRELQYGRLAPSTSPKRVMIAGGGPAGMKAAAVAAGRGHQVSLYEKSKNLGGQALLAQLLPRRSEFGGIVSNLEREVHVSGAEIFTNCEVDSTLVDELEPDVLIVATGATVHRPDIEGIDEGHVLDAWQVLQEQVNVGARVVIADWRCDWIGMGLAEKLARDGCHVRLASTGYIAGENIPRYTRDVWLGELHKLSVEFVPLARLFGVDEDTAYFQHMASGEALVLEDVDTLVLSQGHVPDTRLERSLEHRCGEMHVIGDCLAARTAEEAVLEGLKVGAEI